MTDASPAPRLLPRLILLAAAALIALAAWWAFSAWRDWQRGYDPQTVVAASLQGLQEQNVLVPFTARYVAVVTSTQTRLGLEAKKTLIMPGTVRVPVEVRLFQFAQVEFVTHRARHDHRLLGAQPQPNRRRG